MSEGRAGSAWDSVILEDNFKSKSKFEHQTNIRIDAEAAAVAAMVGARIVIK